MSEDHFATDSSSTDSSSTGSRFLPGQLLGDGRYRIVSLLGRGAVGEVYRADDLTLRTPVALKLLKEERRRDRVWARNLEREVQAAREVSHPYVCRIHDIGHHRGTPYVSMEYTAGEDLFALLARIGPLPEAKALELAHQVCSGLAAIHDQGLLHRDLKPSNIMIDRQGMAKITDFGLAAWVGDRVSPGEGTWPYMAPEQLAGAGVSERSDLYSLGLVICEMFTGRRAYREKERPGPPNTAGLPPEVESTVLHCVADEPGDRPATAREVAAALPEPKRSAGGPARFPPPRALLVPRAADGLSRRAAWSALLALLVGLVLTTLLGTHTHAGRWVHPDAGPAVLESEARRAARQAGHPRGAHSLSGFAPGASGGLEHWYREDPRPLVPWRHGTIYRTPGDPPPGAGSLLVRLTPEGRLLSVVTGAAGGGGQAAGAEGVLAVPVEERAGGLAGVSAAARWLWFLAALVGALYLARRNWRRDCADRRAALRLALYLAACRMLAWVFGDHAASWEELAALRGHLAWALYFAGLGWLLHVGLEPILRRDRTEALVAWVRLFHGRPRDPRVGRDLLLGALLGVAAMLWAQVCALGAGVLGSSSWSPGAWSPLVWQVEHRGAEQQLEALRGVRQAMAVVFHAHIHAVVISLFAVAGFVLLGRLLRRPDAATAVTLALWALVLHPGEAPVTLGWVAAVGAAALWLVTLLRLGLLAAVTAATAASLLAAVPLTADPSLWYADRAALAIATVAALGLFGFTTALAGRPAWPGPTG